MKYITRNRQARGYQVRLIDPHGQPYSRFFSDRRHGSARLARRAALAWRDAELMRMGRIDALRHAQRSSRQKSRTNSSGVIGVIRIDRLRDGRSGGVYRELGWKGYGMIDGRSWSRFFSIRLYGECGAFRRACAARYDRQGIVVVTGDSGYLPCLPGCPYRVQELP